MTTYYKELCEDYKVKLSSPDWELYHSLLLEELHKTEYKLHQIKEQDLCVLFQKERIFASISQKMK